MLISDQTGMNTKLNNTEDSLQMKTGILYRFSLNNMKKFKSPINNWSMSDPIYSKPMNI